MKVILFLVLVLLGSFLGWQYLGEEWVILRYTCSLVFFLTLVVTVLGSIIVFKESDWWLNHKSDSALFEDYTLAGAEFGDAVSYIYLGECVGFESILRDFEMWEQEYARRGYRTISIADFVDYIGYGKPLPFVLVKREASEEAVLYGKLYREKCLGKNINTITFNEDGSFSGTYVLPDL